MNSIRSASSAPAILNCVSQQYTHWVTEDGVEVEWDNYTSQLQSMDMQDLISIHLKDYARYIGE